MYYLSIASVYSFLTTCPDCCVPLHAVVGFLFAEIDDDVDGDDDDDYDVDAPTHIESHS
jgi:hypothetical protein